MARKNSKAFDLRAKGHTLDEIAAEMGYETREDAVESVKAGIVGAHGEGLDERKILSLRRTEIVIAKGMQLIESDDVGTKDIIRAMSTVLLADKRQAEILGSDAPARSVHEVISLDAIDAEIARLSAELAARPPGVEAPQA